MLPKSCVAPKAPAKWSKKGCMKGKGGPKNSVPLQRGWAKDMGKMGGRDSRAEWRKETVAWDF